MQYTDPVLEEIEETFQRFDQNGNRGIEFDEFLRVMMRMDHTWSRPALQQQFAAIDADHDGRVTFREFRAWCDTGR